MPKMPQAAPLPDRPPLHLTGGYLAIASPSTIVEACLSVPAVRALRKARPNSTMVVVANQETAPVWKVVYDINYLIRHKVNDSPRRIASLLEECNVPFDSSIAWEEGPAAAAFAKAKIIQRLGPNDSKLNRFLTDPVKVVREIGPIEHHVNHYLYFVHKLAIDPFQPEYFKPPKRPELTKKTPIAVVPGSDFGPAAEWPREKFAKLCEELRMEYPLLIFPSPENPGPANALAKDLGDKSLICNDVGYERLRKIRKSRLMIANDGTLPHLASLVGTPAIVLFGPNEPDWKRPLGRIHKILRRHVPCSPCLLSKCPLDHRCLEEISVKQVMKEARAKLDAEA